MKRAGFGIVIGSLLIVFVLFNPLYAQVFHGTGGAVTKEDYNEFEISVNNFPQLLSDSTYGMQEIVLNCNGNGKFVLDAYLKSPNGLTIDLSYRSAVSQTLSSIHFISKKLAMEDVPTSSEGALYIPYDAMGNLNAGLNPLGTWTLYIKELSSGIQMLDSWNLIFGTSAANPKVQFLSSDLPIIVINTKGKAILDEPKIIADMGIIYKGSGNRNKPGDPFNHFNGKIGIELRGQSSQTMFQKQYGIEIRDAVDTSKSIDVALLGMPKESDWVLYAPATDKSMLRNYLAYNWFRQMGNYASRTQFCEVIINGVYKGVFVLEEKIKRNKNRVNITKLNPEDTTGASLTGGYIIASDKDDTPENSWTKYFYPNRKFGSVTFQYISPKPTEIAPAQKKYIIGYLDSMVTSLFSDDFSNPVTGYNKYIDANSFIDFLLINELSMNIDSYYFSSYLYKNRSSKLCAGPAWDFNIAFGNVNYIFSNTSQGWRFRDYSNFSHNFAQWNVRLLQDPGFRSKLLNRWQALRTTFLSNANIVSYIESSSLIVQEARRRHYSNYQVLGKYVWPNPEPFPQTYEGEVSYLKNWLIARVKWMDENIQHINSYFKPVVADEIVQTNEDTKTTFNISSNDFDLQNSTLSYEIVEPKLGKITFDVSKGNITYVPNQNVFGTDTVFYKVCNSYDSCVLAKAIVTINPIDDDQIVKNEVYTFTNEQTLTSNILVNDNDSLDADFTNANLMLKNVLKSPTLGTISYSTDGKFTYIPKANLTGLDTILFSVCAKGTPDVCITDTVFINLMSPDASIYPSSINLNMKYNESYKGNILEGYYDSNFIKTGDVTFVSLADLVKDPLYGIFSRDTSGIIEYVPFANESVVDSVLVKVCIQGNNVSVCRNIPIIFNVKGIENHIPIVKNELYTFTNEQTLTSNILVNDNDSLDADFTNANLMLKNVLKNPTLGTISFTTEGKITYIPQPGLIGLDTIIVSICEKNTPGLCASDTVFINLKSPDVKINPRSINLNIRHDETYKGNIFEGYYDSNFIKAGESSFLTLTDLVKAPLNGVFSKDTLGNIEYVPFVNETVVDSILVKVCIEGVNVSVCRIMPIIFNVKGIENHNPVAKNKSYTLTNEQTLTSNILGNDEDSLDLINVLKYPRSGTISYSTNGKFTYVPKAGSTGPDTITFKVCKKLGAGLCTQYTVFINLESPDVQIYPTSVSLNIRYDEIYKGNIFSDYYDVNFIKARESGFSLSADVVKLPSYGTFVIDTSGNIEYAPFVNEAVVDSMWVNVCIHSANVIVCRVMPIVFNVMEIDSVSNPNLELSLFPNPANEWLNIDVSSRDAEKIKIEIIEPGTHKISMVIPETTQLNNLINIQSLSNGLYFIRVYRKSGISNYKFIKL